MNRGMARVVTEQGWEGGYVNDFKVDQNLGELQLIISEWEWKIRPH